MFWWPKFFQNRFTQPILVLLSFGGAMNESNLDNSRWPLTCDICGQKVRSVVFSSSSNLKTCLYCSARLSIPSSDPKHRHDAMLPSTFSREAVTISDWLESCPVSATWWGRQRTPPENTPSVRSTHWQARKTKRCQDVDLTLFTLADEKCCLYGSV